MKGGIMEVTEYVRLQGPRESVLRDAARLSEFVRTLQTAASHYAANLPNADPSWPHYENALLTYNGHSAKISQRQELILIPLLAAHGAIVSKESLRHPFEKAGLSPNGINVYVHRLRKAIRSLPSILIETVRDGAVDGYRLRLVKE